MPAVRSQVADSRVKSREPVHRLVGELIERHLKMFLFVS